jgi:hypothetical protein
MKKHRGSCQRHKGEDSLSTSFESEGSPARTRGSVQLTHDTTSPPPPGSVSRPSRFRNNGRDSTARLRGPGPPHWRAHPTTHISVVRFDCPSAWPWSAALASPPNHPHHANRPQQASRAPTVDTKRGYGRQRPRCNRVGEGDGCTDAGPQQTEHARTPRRASDQPWGPPKTTHQKTP